MSVPVPVRLVAVQVACLVIILLAGEATAGRSSVHDQIVWVNVAVIAAVASALASGLWLVGLRRAMAARTRLVVQQVDAGSVADEIDPACPTPHLVAVPGMTLVHRPDCALVIGKQTRRASAGEPCGWCRP